MRTGRELVAPGPAPTPTVAQDLVRDLREAAETSVDLVLRTMRLAREDEDHVRTTLAGDQVLVIDRLGWVEANAQTFAEIAAAYVKAPRSRGQRVHPTVRAGSVQLGTVLSVIAGRVLGQFDPLGSHRRLLLVAPNVLAVERHIDANPRDFRLWVTLHETTHRVQFARAGWMRQYLHDRIDRVVSAQSSPNLGDFIQAVVDGSLLSAVTSPEQRQAVSEITAVMSVLEGHADVVMDAVGPSVIPTVRDIRRAFDKRREFKPGVRGFVAKLLGIDEKLEQYRKGAAFISAIVAQRGHVGLHPLWSAPEYLPTETELHSPQQWLARVPEDWEHP